VLLPEANVIALRLGRFRVHQVSLARKRNLLSTLEALLPVVEHAFGDPKVSSDDANVASLLRHSDGFVLALFTARLAYIGNLFH